MRLLSYNIQYGYGQDNGYDLSRIAHIVTQSDIAALQEVDRHWSRTGFDDQPALLARATGRFAVYGAGFDMDAATPEEPLRRRQFGPLILSRWPILWSRTHLLPLHRMIQPINTQTCALEAVIATPKGPLRLFNLHLAHVGRAERLAQIEHLKTLAAQTSGPWSGQDDEPSRNWTASQPEPPCPMTQLWMGDFNMEPGAPEYLAITGETPYHPGALYAGQMVDAVAHLGQSLHTHEKVIAGELRLRQLDHIFASAELVPRLRRAWTRPEIASDHFPLWVEMD
ncbi:endonuclease/exonuclease/phosphatase family protein [Stagnihabitans tardus]|uniref:EEP domain-containing protein n=1 Tax=Stagnihabitans tardus TaxID=2699202 RepID=A0AAE4Y8W3_9RHOB|nr:endonuclease/exonuclease/phosphatase family protein [Stagnihabitans tardus]NBZ88123.1 EEP domain-containing protein [Stagnihabitans tardus]